MGERDNHINQGTSLSPEDDLLTHGHGERGRVVDGEVQPEEDGGDDGHGGSPWPPFFLGDGAAMEEPLPSLTAAWEEEFSWCPLT